MAKDITIKNPQGTVTYYPKTVSQLVYDNDSGRTVKEDITELNADVSSLEYRIVDKDLFTFNGIPSSGGYYTPMFNGTNLSIPTDTKIRIEVVQGWDTAVDSIFYAVNSGGGLRINKRVFYIEPTETINTLKVYTLASAILDDTIEIEVKATVVSIIGGIEENISQINTSITEINNDLVEVNNSLEDTNNEIESLNNLVSGSHLFSASGFPRDFVNATPMYLNSDLNVPIGCKIRVEITEGFGDAISAIYYNLGGGTTSKTATKSVFDIEAIDAPITYLKIYTNASTIIDNTIQLSAVGDVIGVVDNLEETVEKHEEIFSELLSENIGKYEGYPQAANLIVASSLNYPIGSHIRITVDGMGTAISKYRYILNDGTYIERRVEEDNIILTEPLTYFRLWVATSMILDRTIPLNISVDRIGELEELSDSLQESEVTMQDFNTDYVISRYASDPINKAFESNTYNISIGEGNHVDSNVIIYSLAKYTVDEENPTDDVPTIQFLYNRGSTNIYTSTKYTIGRKDYYENKEWRIPKFYSGATLSVIIVVPQYVTLYIKDISNRFSDVVMRQSLGYRMNAHLNLYNFNTLRGITESARLGYPCAIVVPKRTSDGVWVCFHDDDNINNLRYRENPSQRVCWLQNGVYNRYDVEGNRIGEGAMPISSIPYEQLCTYCYPLNIDSTYERVPLLEDFIYICAKTGMHPMFSCHGQSASSFTEVKEMLEKYGLLKYLNIKSAFSSTDHNATFNAFYNIFGNEIESYTADVNVDTNINTLITAFERNLVGQHKTEVRVGFELFSNRLGSDNSKVLAIREAGYFAAIADMQSSPTNAMTAEQIEYWIRQGVTEWTEYRMFSYGLNW